MTDHELLDENNELRQKIELLQNLVKELDSTVVTQKAVIVTKQSEIERKTQLLWYYIGGEAHAI